MKFFKNQTDHLSNFKTYNHSILLALIRFHLLFHSLSFIVTHCHLLSVVVIRCHSFSFIVILCTTRCHSLSFVVLLVAIRCHSFYHLLSLDELLVCLFINDHSKKPSSNHVLAHVGVSKGTLLQTAKAHIYNIETEETLTTGILFNTGSREPI